MMMFDDMLPRANGKLRLLHAVPNAPNVDVYANSMLLYSNLAFGNITKYIDVPVGSYNIKIFKSGTKDNAIITENYQVASDSISTVAVTAEDNKISFFVVDDSHKVGNPDLASIRFINLSPDSKLLTLRLPENMVLFNETSYLETNNYYPTSEGIYNFVVVNSDDTFEKYISNVNLNKNIFITIYIIGLFKGNPQAGYILVKDGE